MMTARTAMLAGIIVMVSACSGAAAGAGDETTQAADHGATHLAGGGSLHLAPGQRGFHLNAYKCDDTEREMSMCGNGEPTHVSHVPEPEWLRDVSRPHKMR